jgi:hypothetical protein
MQEFRETYRKNPIVGFVGVGGLAFVLYVFLYNAGAIRVMLFEHVGDAPLSQARSWVAYSMMWALGTAALWISANRITITDQAMVYTAPLRRVVIRWDEVTEVALSKGPGFDVRSDGKRIVVDCWYVKASRLRQEVLKRAPPSVVRHGGW